MPLIQVENLTIRYPTRRSPALRDISFSVEQGEAILLLGPSGGGKSTLALALTGLIPHTIAADAEGRVCVNDTELLAPDARPGQLTQRVGIVFQDPESQFSTLTVADEVAFGLENLAIPYDQMDRKIDAALAKVGLQNERSRRLDHLSGGQKQKLALACALAMEPQVLILDEPTANLDPEATGSFFRLLDGLRGASLTLILIEHKLDNCMHLVERVLLLNHEGRLMADGEPRKIFGDYWRAIQEWGIWLPQVTEVALMLDYKPGFEPPLRLDDGVQHFKARLPLIVRRQPETWESPGTHPAAGARAAVVDHLTHTYPNGVKALDEVSLSVPVGDFLAILGPNGAGKTTLAAHMAGILSAPRDKVQLFGFDVADLSPAQRAERVGFVFQNPEHQFVTDRVDTELGYSLRLRSRRDRRPAGEIEKRVEELLGLLDLQDLGPANPFTLSQGQKRRLSVGTMLSVGQRLLVLDEPTFGQDRRSSTKIMQTLADLNHMGVTIVVITHDMRLVAHWATSAALLVEGKMIYHGAARDLFYQDVLLVQAGLWPPPLFDLTLSLRRWQHDFPDLMTVDEYVAAFRQEA